MKELDKIFSFKSSGIKLGAGKLLISEPFMPDYYFKRSVIYLADHNQEEGSFGLIINKKTEYTLDEVSNEFGDFQADVYLGGPVQTNSLFYLHKRGDLIEDSLEISKGVFWGGNFDQLVRLIKDRILKEDEIRFFLGYAGWNPEQLKREIDEKSWLVSQVKANDIFSTQPDKLWSKCIQKMGTDFSHWLNFPTNPQWN